MEEENNEEEDAFSGKIRVPLVFRSGTQLSIKQGRDELVRFCVWSTLTPCMSEECPIFEGCPHEEKKQRGGKCKVEQSYINTVASMVYRNFHKRFTEDQFFIVGMHILPMYRHLCRLKIWEWSVREVMYEDDKGRRHLNPIFREIREQIKAISGQWRMLGVGQYQVMEPRNPWGQSGKPMVEAKPYYDRMGEIEDDSMPRFGRNKVHKMQKG